MSEEIAEVMERKCGIMETTTHTITTSTLREAMRQIEMNPFLEYQMQAFELTT